MGRDTAGLLRKTRTEEKQREGKRRGNRGGAAGGGEIFRERSLPEEEGAQVWFLFSWTSLLPDHFVMISGFASFFFFLLFILMYECEHCGFYYVLGCSWML